MHLLEDFFSLAADLYADLLAQSVKVIRQLTSCLRGIIGIYDHHHVKIFLYDRLGDIQNVYLVLRKVRAYFCENTDSILAPQQ